MLTSSPQALAQRWLLTDFPVVEGKFSNDMAPDDRKARIQFLNAYMKIGWFDKGDTIDFIFERDENRSRVTQIHHTVRSGGKVDRILYPTEAPGRMAYPEGSAHFITQIYAIWYGKNNDGADPGMSIARKTIIKGDQSQEAQPRSKVARTILNLGAKVFIGAIKQPDGIVASSRMAR